MEEQQYQSFIFASPQKQQQDNNQELQQNNMNRYYTPDIKLNPQNQQEDLQNTFNIEQFQTTDYKIRKNNKLFHNSPFISPNQNKDQYSDRFIPLRVDPVSKSLFGLKDELKIQQQYFQQNEFQQIQQQQQQQIIQVIHKPGNNQMEEEIQEKQMNYNNMLEQELVCERNTGNGVLQNIQNNNFNILKFRSPNVNEAKKLNQYFQVSPFQTQTSYNQPEQKPKNLKKAIQKKPYKVLDAPGLTDDFYLDIVDWSNTNIISVCLDNVVYLWGADGGGIVKMTESNNQHSGFSSLKFSPNGHNLLVGNQSGQLQLWDIEKNQLVKSYDNLHQDRVGTLCWNNNYSFATGSKDKSISIFDIRANQRTYHFKSHTQEVCGLSFSQNEGLLASGGNDNKVILWNLTRGDVEIKFREHKAAVKAVEFSPHQNGLLMTGGGTKDQTICLWNTLSQSLTQKIQVGSQVCKLKFSKNSNEFISTHGFEDNEIIVWKYPSLQKTAVLEGHDRRVLFIGMSPDGKKIVTGAGDETLKFWKVFPGKKTKQASNLQFNINDLR